MIRRVHVLAAGFAGLATFATEASSQLNVGAHMSWAADSFGGVRGIGASLELDVPLLPVDLMVAGDYFLVDCGAAVGCSFAGASADVHLPLPVPFFQPYGLGGIVYRRYAAGEPAEPTRNTGFAVGGGVNLGAISIGAYAEARYEIIGTDDQLVFRVGIRS